MGRAELFEDICFGVYQMRNHPTHFNFYFRGTLASLKGVLDYLLEEYNVRFNLGISADKDLNVRAFSNKATNMNNKDAIEFIGDYKKTKETLLEDEKVKLLLGQHGVRDQEIHRKHLPLNIDVKLIDTLGNRNGLGSSQPTFSFFLKAWPNDDIPTLCEYVSAELANAVALLDTKYPAT